MKRLFISVFALLLGISLLRVCNGKEYMSLSTMLRALSVVDISFEYTLGAIADLRSMLSFPELANLTFLEVVGQFFVWLYNMFVGVLKVPVELLRDVLDFLYSCLEFFTVLIS